MHGWHDGPCAAGKRTLTQHDFRLRITDIQAQLDDEETSQSNGYFRNQELRGELAMLESLTHR
jgi:hypothetical protein